MKFLAFIATFKYRFIAGVAILAALAISLFAAYTVGHNKGKNISVVEIARYENKIGTLQGQLIDAQGAIKIETVREYFTKIQYVDRVVEKNTDIIRNNVVSRVETISEGAIYAHNQAALNYLIDPKLASSPAPSGITDASFVASVAENYGIANRCIITADALQKYIRDMQEARKNVKK